MARARVLSFMSTFGGPPRSPTEKTHSNVNSGPPPTGFGGPMSASVTPTPRDLSSNGPARQRAASRPMSMIGGYQPPLMEIASDTIPELAPIFTFLNSHSNKLYQEGYFLKLSDLDSQGRTYPDRSWTECFAQLVGTVLSLWDASALDAAGQDSEVSPTFINLADASIKMIETLPTRSNDSTPLTNVLSISTAGKNRYLFHFSNVNALTQWTAGIRLAMFENSSLQEAYTGSLIAGKGKTLNSIKTILVPSKFQTEEWTRVRFGAGTPWRRCWCVIAPPTEKEIAAFRKTLKKKSAYDRSTPILKGDIKFYDTRKTKKALPIATIRDAYSAYAIYPQSKPLIDQSTLIKIEGVITIHTKPETTTEGFIFVMPEARPAVSGFEMMLRFLFPIYDVFALYGRPTRLVADTLDTRSLMFAMPSNRRYGYLEIFDVATLIHAAGSQSWSEREWKKQLKQLTSQRITRMGNGSKTTSRAPSRHSHHSHRNSLPSRSAALRFQNAESMQSSPSLVRDTEFAPTPPPHTGSAPPGNGPFEAPQPPPSSSGGHQRSMSETVTPMGSPRRQRDPPAYQSSRLSREAGRMSLDDDAPPPPAHGLPVAYSSSMAQYGLGENERSSSESEHRYQDLYQHGDSAARVQEGLLPNLPPSPVVAPPAFSREPGAKPQTRPYQSPELRRANSRMSTATLSQLAAASNYNVAPASSSANVASGSVAAAGAAAAWRAKSQSRERSPEDQDQRGVNDYNNTSSSGITADVGRNKGLVLDGLGYSPRGRSQSPSKSYFPTISSDDQSAIPSHLHAPSTHQQRNISPLSQTTIAPKTPDSEFLTTFRPHSSESSSPRRASTPSQPTITPSELDVSPRPSGPSNEQIRNPPPLKTRFSIARKPIPKTMKRANSPGPSDNAIGESPQQYRLDEAAFNRVNTMKSTASTELSRNNSRDSSHYDPVSAASPNYQTELDSNHTQPPLPIVADSLHDAGGEKDISIGDTRYLANAPEAPVRSDVRTGVLKTVGVDNGEKEVVIGDAHYRPRDTLQSSQPISTEGWGIDFGPTHQFSPAIGSSTPERPRSTESKSLLQNDGSGLLAPSGKGRVSPGHVIDAYSRSPNRSILATPEPGTSRPSSAEGSEKKRNVAWQPSAATSTSTQRQSLTPEQFVQQKFADSRVTPVYAHNRQSSASSPQNQSRRTSRTPPLTSRHSSGDWSAALPTRPHSRGASTTMNVQQDYSAHLSAREQEQVARATGSPLLNMGGTQTRPASQLGLVGAIEAREREKKDTKSGTSKMVQQAIAQRQQQVQSYQYPQSSPQMHVPGQFPPSPAYDTAISNPQQDYMQNHPMTQQQQWARPAHGHPTAYGNTTPQSGMQGQYYQGQNPQFPQSQYAQTPQQGGYQQGQYQGQYQQPPQGQHQGQHQQPQGQYANQQYPNHGFRS